MRWRGDHDDATPDGVPSGCLHGTVQCYANYLAPVLNRGSCISTWVVTAAA